MNKSWARTMQVLFRYAIHLYHQHDQLPPDQFATQVARVERQCDRLLKRVLAPPEAKRSQRRFLKHRDKLFLFLYCGDVEPTNNIAERTLRTQKGERALRPSVIHRKVTGCFRSEWGAKAFASLALVIDTADLSGIYAFDAIQALLARLPYPFRLSVCEREELSKPWAF